MSSTLRECRSSSAGVSECVGSWTREPVKNDSSVTWKRSKKDWRKVGRREATPMLQVETQDQRE